MQAHDGEHNEQHIARALLQENVPRPAEGLPHDENQVAGAEEAEGHPVGLDEGADARAQ